MRDRPVNIYLLFASLILLCMVRCELVDVSAPALNESETPEQIVNPTAVDQVAEQDRNLKDNRKLQRKRGASSASRIPVQAEMGPYVVDDTQDLKDRFRPRGKKYDNLIHRYERLTRAFNLMADEDEFLMSEIGTLGTRLDIPLHPIAIMHMVGRRQPLEARKLKAKAGHPKKISHRSVKHKRQGPSAYKERILSARKSWKGPNKRARASHKLHQRHHSTHRAKRRSRRLSRTITNNQISMFDPRVMMGQNKSGGEGIAAAEATPQLFDAGITIHNYAPASSTHPMFFDALDQDSKPQVLEANIFIPPPRLLQARPIAQPPLGL